MDMMTMSSKLAMKKLLVLGNLIMCILLILLIHDTFSDSGKIQHSPLGDQHNTIMRLNMRRLVTGKDSEELEATGFACHSDLDSDVCVSTNQIRFETKTQTIYLAPSYESNSPISPKFVIIKPYPTKKQSPTALKWVTPLHIIQQPNFNRLPKCEFYYDLPALVFSTGGYAGNMFHGFNDVIIPLFITSHHFRTQIRLVITDYDQYWVDKFSGILRRLSLYETINVSNKSEGVHCFSGGVVGIKYHNILGVNSTDIPTGYKFEDFRKMLFEAYNLKYYEILLNPKRPILVLISRRESRVFLNEDEMVKMMNELGFQVVIALANEMENLDKFSQVVNSGHVMVGAHGAGLTNQVFLPKGGVVIEVVPIGVDWASDIYYAGPAPEMGLNHLKYRVEFEESSLSDLYGPDDPVITNPNLLFEKGYLVGKKIYFNGQNMTINVTRFKETLSHALKLLSLQ